MSRIGIAAIVLLLLTGMSGQAADKVSLEVLIGGGVGDQGQKGFHSQLVTDTSAWQKLHGRLIGGRIPKPALPKVDFKQNLLIYIGLGQKNSGGYGISVPATAPLEGGIVTISLQVTQPKPGSMAITVITSPFIIIKIPRSGVQEIRLKQADGTITGTLSVPKP